MKRFILIGLLVGFFQQLNGQNQEIAILKSGEFAHILQEKLNLSDEKMCAIQLIVEDVMIEALKDYEGKRINQRRFMQEQEPIFIPRIKELLTEEENYSLDSILTRIEKQRLTIQNRRKEILLKKGKKKKKNSQQK